MASQDDIDELDSYLQGKSPGGEAPGPPAVVAAQPLPGTPGGPGAPKPKPVDMGGDWDLGGMAKAYIPAVGETLKSYWQNPSEAGRALSGVAAIPTYPFRALADKIAEMQGLGGGSMGADFQQAFGRAHAADNERGLISYGTSLAHTLGIEETRGEHEDTIGDALVGSVFKAAGLGALPKNIQRSVGRGVLNLVGGVLEDPTALTGLGAGAVTAEQAPRAVAKLGGLVTQGLAVASVPGLSAEAGTAFGNAQSAYENGDYAKAAQHVIEGMGYLGLGAFIGHGLHGELKAGAGGEAPHAGAGTAPGAPQVPELPVEAGAPAGGAPAPPAALPIPPEAPASPDFDLDLANVGTTHPSTHSTDLLHETVSRARDTVLGKEALDPQTLTTTKEAIAELRARGEEVPLHEVDPMQAYDILYRQYGDADMLGESTPAQLDAHLQDLGLKLKEPEKLGEPPDLGTPEHQAMVEKLTAPDHDARLEAALQQPPPTADFSKPETADLHAQALEIVKKNDKNRMLFPHPDDLTDSLKAKYGDRAAAAAHKIVDIADHAVSADQWSRNRYQMNRPYDREGGALQPPADLTSRTPDFNRDGARQWVGLFDHEGNELSRKNPPANQEKLRLISWVEDPATGKLHPAGGITNLSGEQHFLVHNRRIGDHNIASSFDPIRQAADDLGWKEAPPETSSASAQDYYKSRAEKLAKSEAGAYIPEEEDVDVSSALEGEPTEAGGGRAPGPGGAPTEPGVRPARAAADSPSEVPPGGGGPGGPGSSEEVGAPGPAGSDLGTEAPGRPGGAPEENVGGAAAEAGAPGPTGAAAGASATAGAGPGAGQAGPDFDLDLRPQETPAPAPGTPALEAASRAAQAPVPAAAAGNALIQAEPLNATSGANALAPSPSPAGGGGAPGQPPAGGSRPDYTGPLTHQVLRLEPHAEVLKTAEDVLNAAGIVWDRKSVPVLSDHIGYHILNGSLPLATLADNLYSKGMSIAQFYTELWRPAVRESAQRLATLSQLSRKLVQVVEAEKAGKEFGKAAAVLEDASSGLAVHPDATSLARKSFNIWRKMIITQPSTLARIGTTEFARLGIASLTDSVELSLQRACKAMGMNVEPSARPLEAARVALTSLRGLATLGTDAHYKARAAITDAVLQYADPRYMDQLFLSTVADTGRKAADHGIILNAADKVLNGADRIADKALTLHRGYQHVVYKATMAELLAGAVEAQGKNLADAIEHHGQLLDEVSQRYGKDWAQHPQVYEQFLQDPRNLSHTVDEAMMQKAVDKTLEWHFGSAPKAGSGFDHFIKMVNKTPLMMVFPFPRFFYNALKFTYEYSPVGALHTLVSPAEHAKMRAGDFQAISKGIVGTGMLLAAYQLRQSDDAGERWYEAKTPDGKRTIDLRPYNPFASHLFIADIFARQKKGTLYKLTGQDVATAILNTNLRTGTGLAALDEFLKSATTIGSPEDIARSIKRMTGTFLSGYLTPLQVVADFYSQFDADSRVQRDQQAEPFLGPFKMKIPGASKTLPEKEAPTRDAAPVNEFPLLKQLAGVSVSEEKNLLERELDRLQFSPNEILGRVKDPQANALVQHYMGQITEEVLLPLVAQKEYQDLSDSEKGMILAKQLAAARKEARAMAMADRPDLFDPLDRMPFRKRLFMQEAQGEGANADAGAPGPPKSQEDEE